MSKGMAPLVAVVGGAVCTPEQALAAHEVGRLLAERGAVLMCGGRGGVMEAACQGAQEAGGITIGLLPGTDSSEGNPHLTVAIATGLGQARNALVAQAGQAVIAIGGSYGTLSEIGLALKRGRKVIGLQTWKATDGEGSQAAIIEAHSPLEAVDLALAAD
jgi:uncharacterized protein (TIGR00725 family)